MKIHTENCAEKAWVKEGKVTMKGRSTSFEKFTLLLWKNWVLQKRNKIKTVIEVVLPVIFCILLVVIRDLAPSDEFPEPTYFQNFTIDQFPESLKPDQNNGFFDGLADSILGDKGSRRRRSINFEEVQKHILSGNDRWLGDGLEKGGGEQWQTTSDEGRHRKRRSSANLTDNYHQSTWPKSRRKRFSFSDLIFGSSWWPIAYAPNNTAVKNVMEMVADDLWADADDMGFATEADMVKHLTTIAKQDEEGSTFFRGVEDVLGGIVFTNDFPDDKTFPNDINYKIRLKGAPRSGSKRNPFAPPPQWLTEVSYPLFQVPGPRERKKNTGGRPGYYGEGFLTLQYAVDMALARYISKDDTATDFSKIVLQRMPYPEYIDDKYLVALQAWMPFVLLASYIYPAINLVKSIVYEKEKKLKESMKMMGLPNWLHWTAWFIKSFMFLIVSTILITILLCTPWQGSGSMAVLHNSDPTLVFAFLALYTICSISFCFFLSTVFSKANNASTATGLLWFFTYFPYMVLRPRYSSLTQGNKIMLCLLSNTAMSLGCQLASMFEGTGAGIQWHLLFTGVSPDDQFTLAHVFMMLILDTLLFSILTWYIEAVRPGEFGVPKPWYFPVTASYWCGTQRDINAAESAKFDHEKDSHDPDYFEPDPIGLVAGVKVQGLTKIFPRGNKVAVSKVFLDMYEGQITVLLGHNGAGKTTTMSMLTGLFPPTSGTAKVGGYDIVTEMNEVRMSLGLCPQHDVLFDQLTVSEHLYFFCRLKGMDPEDVNREVVEMVDKLKLSDKFDAESRTLSGGMKRKLSVGIALCASSRVVFLDEPTSGMDPGARRVIWDLLQQERSKRTVLLTTHFMEEADLLGDRIAIMADGVIRCCGSSLFLKKKYGAGYRLVTVKEKGCDVDAVTELLKSHIPEAELDQNVGLELSYVLPNSNVSKFEELFTELEKRKEELKISSYGASQTTMDEVFLRVGEATNSEVMNRPKDTTVIDIPKSVNGIPKSANGDIKFSRIPPSSAENGHSLTPIETNELINNHDPIEQIQLDPIVKNGVVSNGIAGGEGGEWFGSAIQRFKCAINNVRDTAYPETRRRTPLQRNNGCILLIQQFWAMLVKKFLYTARNKILSITQVLIPVAFLILALIVVNSIPGINDAPPQLPFRLSNFDGTYTPVQVINSNNNTQKLLDALGSSLTGKNKMEVVPSDKNFSTFILENAKADLPSFNLHSMVAISISGDTLENSEAVLYFNSQPFHVLPLAINMLDTAIVRVATGKKDLTISTTNHPLPRTDTDKLTQDSRQNLGFQIGFNLAFGMSFLAASFVLFLVQESSSKAKHLQFVSGVNFVTYWSATALWDYIVHMVPVSLCILCLYLFGHEGLSEGSQLQYFLLVLVMYAWATLPLMYLASFCFTVPSTGFTKMTIINIITGMATLITVTILRIPDLDLMHVADMLDWLFLLFPSYAMASAITDLYTNNRFTDICSRPVFTSLCNIKTFANPCCKSQDNCGDFGCVDWNENFLAWEKLGIGRYLFFMALEGFLFYFIISLIEIKLFSRLRYVFCRLWRKVTVKKVNDMDNVSEILLPEDADVKAERLRIHNTPLDHLMKTDKLIFRDLCKTYSTSTGELQAVNRTNLGVPLGECFGLLGINGAGKTTTFKMLTGDLTVSSGDAFVNGFSIKSDIKKVQQHVGYCPQFDAILDQMTGREALRMFARLRGVPENQISDMITTIAEQLLVTQHLDNLFGNYSGGNKRKVSTGVALIGDPPLVLLDEPTSGMDPVARRLLWDVLSNVRDSGRSIILTSHSMEECEALCTRLAIMVNGTFRCLGSPQHLKSKFSEGYSIIIRVKLSPESQLITIASESDMPEEMRRVKEFIEKTFQGCLLREMQIGRLEYFAPANNFTWGGVFGIMERNRIDLDIVDYSVTQTTLERVFLSFTRSQRPEDDG